MEVNHLLFILMVFSTLFFLACTFFLVAICSAFRSLHKKDVVKEVRGSGKLFPYGIFHNFFFPNGPYESLFFSLICAQNVSRFLYTTSFVIGLAALFFPFQDSYSHLLLLCFIVIAFMLISFIVSDYLPRILGSSYPINTLRICLPLTTPILFLVFPFTYLFLKISHSSSQLIQPYESMGRQEIIDMLQHADLSPAFDVHDKNLIESVVQFKERIAREVMVPRVDLFSLPAEISIKEAAKLLQGQEYSRTPVYRTTVDNIVGVLMYKDILRKYIEYELKNNDPAVLSAPIETIQKNILHTPETKKLSSLLQEFRKKQVHLAIVVDEYGGTAGIVTIEDILEEIVGEIADEYDEEEVELYYVQPDGSWVVDARMNILDAEEQLGVEIPQEGEYDTIGGYIYHTTGSIPAKGFVIHHDKFDMEILKSNERSVEKVRIKSINGNEKNGEKL